MKPPPHTTLRPAGRCAAPEYSAGTIPEGALSENAAYIPVVAARAALAVLGRGALYWVLAAVLAAVTAVTDLSYALGCRNTCKSLGSCAAPNCATSSATRRSSPPRRRRGRGRQVRNMPSLRICDGDAAVSVPVPHEKALPVDKNTMTPDGMTALREKVALRAESAISSAAERRAKIPFAKANGILFCCFVKMGSCRPCRPASCSWSRWWCRRTGAEPVHRGQHHVLEHIHVVGVHGLGLYLNA